MDGDAVGRVVPLFIYLRLSVRVFSALFYTFSGKWITFLFKLFGYRGGAAAAWTFNAYYSARRFIFIGEWRTSEMHELWAK